MKFSELYRMLERDGWHIIRTNKHHVFAHPTKPKKIPVGKHASQEVPFGTFKSIMKLAGIIKTQ